MKLVPVDLDRANNVLRYSETTVNSDRSFKFTNIAPGHYFIVSRIERENRLACACLRDDAPAESKRVLLDKILKQYHGSVLLFTRTKQGARKVARTVRDMRHTSAEIHSNRSLNQRKEAL